MSDQAAAAAAKTSAVPEHRVRSQARGQAVKTIAIWAVLVVMFCVLYFQFRGGSVWGLIAIVGSIVGGLGVVFGVVLIVVIRTLVVPAQCVHVPRATVSSPRARAVVAA